MLEPNAPGQHPNPKMVPLQHRLDCMKPVVRVQHGVTKDLVTCTNCDVYVFIPKPVR